MASALEELEIEMFDDRHILQSNLCFDVPSSQPYLFYLSRLISNLSQIDDDNYRAKDDVFLKAKVFLRVAAGGVESCLYR